MKIEMPQLGSARLGTFTAQARLSQKIPARAEPSYEDSEPSRAELGHFNFRAETELTILTICMSKNSKFLTYFPILLLYHDSNQFHDHLFEFIRTKGVFRVELYDLGT